MAKETKLWTQDETVKAIAIWENAGKNWQERGQTILMQGLMQWVRSGNVKPMLVYANAIEAMDVKAMRKNSMRRWFEVVCKFTYDTETKLFTHGGNTKFTTALSMVPKWYDALKEESYTPIDEIVILEAAIKKLKVRLAEPKGDNVHKTTVDALEAILAQARAAKEGDDALAVA
jgi:hypothetical protein